MRKKITSSSKQTDETGLGSEAGFRYLIQNTSDIITILEYDGTVRYANPAAERVLGYPPGEQIGTNAFGSVHPNDRERARSIFAELVDKPGIHGPIEFRVPRADGSWCYLEHVVNNLLDDPSIRGIVVSSRDTTERKRIEQELRELSQRNELILRSVGEGILGVDREGRITFANPAAARILGWEVEELLGRHGHPIMHHTKPDGTPYPREECLIHASIKDGIRRGVTDEVFWRKDGTSFFTEYKIDPIETDEEVVGAVITFTDSTEHKRAEEEKARRTREVALRADVSAALAASGTLQGILQQCTEAMVEHLNAAFASIWVLNQEENVLELQASSGMYAHLDGAHSRVPVGQFRIGLIAQEQLPHLTNEVVDDPCLHDKEWARREGMVSFAGYPLICEERMVGVMAMFARQQLTEADLDALASVADVLAQGIERKRAEEALRRSENSLATAQRIAHIGNWDYDVAKDEAYWSDEMYRIFGFSPQEFVPTYRTFLKLVHPEDTEFIRKSVRKALYGGTQYDIEYRIVRPDGEIRSIHTQYEVLHDETGRPIRLIGTLQDITERKRAEERLQEANRRLEELAVLRADFTAMVAHELDTPLTVIQGYVGMMDRGKLEPAEWSQAFAKIRAETEVLKALIADVRTAAAVERDDFAVELQRVPVGALLDAAARFAATLPGDHPLSVENAADEQVWADRHRIDQVLRNLLLNAAKYSPDSAPIELRAKPGKTAGRVRIEVVDSGGGVHPDDVSRIFEKFGRGRDRSGRRMAGVGLGLYLSRRIIRVHGSDLTVDSAPRGGSVFSFELNSSFDSYWTDSR